MAHRSGPPINTVRYGHHNLVTGSNKNPQAAPTICDARSSWRCPGERWERSLNSATDVQIAHQNVANLDNLLRPEPLASPAAAANRLSRDVDNDRAARVPDDRVERWLVEVKINDVDISSIPGCD
jgi:hypothetical protein